ncbi:hypothetical protein BDZ94DRAFT_318522 [Collybia nuda]|uniref:Uncharacterized protein n=1 Tax=Collybia nuda TaxID=64659 RepID=A0A9P5XW19_9AGAR|nr:hypothetical protein BDZ94DRAFT_318522 [Collybia nuda]
MSPETPHLGFEANFFSDYSIILDHPITEVFSTIGTSKGHERTTRLSGLCSEFELQHHDTVSIPQNTLLVETNTRSLDSSLRLTSEYDAESLTRQIDRQFFTLQETVPVAFGLLHVKVKISGTLSWDEKSKVALYESKTDSGILIWKSRVFEKIDDKRTRVSEKIRGKCPSWLRIIVQSQTLKGHIAHMDLYPTLF